MTLRRVTTLNTVKGDLVADFHSILARGKNDFSKLLIVQGGREVTVHPDNTHLRLNLSLHGTAQHAVQCKMAVWQQCPRYCKRDMPQPQNVVVFSIWLTQAVTPSRSAWW
jgi:hypothetical protein